MTIDDLPTYSGSTIGAYTLIRFGGVSYKYPVGYTPSGSIAPEGGASITNVDGGSPSSTYTISYDGGTP